VELQNEAIHRDHIQQDGPKESLPSATANSMAVSLICAFSGLLDPHTTRLEPRPWGRNLKALIGLGDEAGRVLTKNTSVDTASTFNKITT